MRQIQMLACECVVCEQLVFDESVQETRAQVVIAGAVKYGVCLQCHQEVGKETMADPEYRRRWDCRKREVEEGRMEKFAKLVWERFMLIVSRDSFGAKEAAEGKRQKNLFGSVEAHKKAFDQAVQEVLVEVSPTREEKL